MIPFLTQWSQGTRKPWCFELDASHEPRITADNVDSIELHLKPCEPGEKIVIAGEVTAVKNCPVACFDIDGETIPVGVYDGQVRVIYGTEDDPTAWACDLPPKPAPWEICDSITVE